MNLVRLASNSLAMNCVGPLVEQESGAQRLLAVYIISTITSIAASCMQPRPSVGSSGKLCSGGMMPHTCALTGLPHDR